MVTIQGHMWIFDWWAMSLGYSLPFTWYCSVLTMPPSSSSQSMASMVDGLTGQTVAPIALIPMPSWRGRGIVLLPLLLMEEQTVRQQQIHRSRLQVRDRWLLKTESVSLPYYVPFLHYTTILLYYCTSHIIYYLSCNFDNCRLWPPVNFHCYNGPLLSFTCSPLPQRTASTVQRWR